MKYQFRTETAGLVLRHVPTKDPWWLLATGLRYDDIGEDMCGVPLVQQERQQMPREVLERAEQEVGDVVRGRQPRAWSLDAPRSQVKSSY